MIEKYFNIYDVMSLSRDSLSYLIDDGYSFNTSGFRCDDIIMEFRYKNSFFNWRDIKYDFIPFLLSLDNIATIEDIRLKTKLHTFTMYITDFNDNKDILTTLNGENWNIFYIEIILSR